MQIVVSKCKLNLLRNLSFMNTKHEKKSIRDLQIQALTPL